MALIAKVRKDVVAIDAEFLLDPTTETVINVDDNKDGTVTVLILSYIRKGS